MQRRRTIGAIAAHWRTKESLTLLAANHLALCNLTTSTARQYFSIINMRAAQGVFTSHHLPDMKKLTIWGGVLIECDPAIRAIILDIEKKGTVKYILEELDEQHLLVSSKSLPQLKSALDKV